MSHVQAVPQRPLYWRLTLADASGALEAKIWHPLSAAFNAIPVGTLGWAEGRAGLYRDQVQLSVEQLRLLTPEECAAVDQAALLPASPYPLDDMLDQLTKPCKAEFVYPAWRKLALGFQLRDLRARFRVCPAAKSVHHAYVGGLLEHTLGVFTLCRRIADQYPELDRQTLLAGALFHDVGKSEFSGGVANDYTTEGRLLGHLMLGLEMLSPAGQIRPGRGPAGAFQAPCPEPSRHAGIRRRAPAADARSPGSALCGQPGGPCRGLFAQPGTKPGRTGPLAGHIEPPLSGRTRRSPPPKNDAPQDGSPEGGERRMFISLKA